MQACTAEAQQLNKSINLKHGVCSIFANTRSDLQYKRKCAYHMDALPSPPLETPFWYHIFTRCIGTDVKSPRSRDKVRDKVPCCTPYRANTKGPISIIVMTIGNCKQGKDKGQLAISCNQVVRSATRRKAVHKVQTHVP